MPTEEGLVCSAATKSISESSRMGQQSANEAVAWRLGQTAPWPVSTAHIEPNVGIGNSPTGSTDQVNSTDNHASGELNADLPRSSGTYLTWAASPQILITRPQKFTALESIHARALGLHDLQSAQTSNHTRKQVHSSVGIMAARDVASLARARISAIAVSKAQHMRRWSVFCVGWHFPDQKQDMCI